MIHQLLCLGIIFIFDQLTAQDIIFDYSNSRYVLERRGFDGKFVTASPNAQTIRPPPPPESSEVPQICYCVHYTNCNANTRTTDMNSNLIVEISPSNGKCEHPLDVCCGNGTGSTFAQSQVSPWTTSKPVAVQSFSPVLLPDWLLPLPHRQPGCGVRNVGGIDGSVDDIETSKYSQFGEFPWTVAIIDKQSDVIKCSGSLIHPSIVLTASHCVKSPGFESLKVRAGEWNIRSLSERLPYQERNANQVRQHSNFNLHSLHYNVAIITLDAPFDLDQHIGLICLPPLDYVPDKKNCFATGWGTEKFSVQMSNGIMKKVPLPIVEFKECQSRLRQTRLSRRFILHPSFTCAGGQLGVDTCQGDGGAPLACPHVVGGETRYIQSGIVAWGIECNTDIPGVYTNVSYMREWIDETVQELGYIIN